jgi:hypothetical protein
MWPGGISWLIAGRCTARHVKTSKTASPIAGTIVQATSLARRGIGIDALSLGTVIGALMAALMIAICATIQASTASQNVMEGAVRDITIR